MKSVRVITTAVRKEESTLDLEVTEVRRVGGRWNRVSNRAYVGRIGIVSRTCSVGIAN